MTLEPDRSFSAVEEVKGILGKGNSMFSLVRKLRVPSLLEPTVLPLISCVTMGTFLPLSVSQFHSAGSSAMQPASGEPCAV